MYMMEILTWKVSLAMYINLMNWVSPAFASYLQRSRLVLASRVAYDIYSFYTGPSFMYRLSKL